MPNTFDEGMAPAGKSLPFHNRINGSRQKPANVVAKACIPAVFPKRSTNNPRKNENNKMPDRDSPKGKRKMT